MVTLAAYFNIALFPQNEEPGRIPAFSTSISQIVESPEPVLSLAPDCCCLSGGVPEPENDSD